MKMNILKTTTSTTANAIILQSNSLCTPAQQSTEKLPKLKYIGGCTAFGRSPTTEKLTIEDIKEFNRLCSLDKWNVNNHPKPFLWVKSPHDSKSAWRLFKKMGYQHFPTVEGKIFPFLNTNAFRVQIHWFTRFLFVFGTLVGFPFVYQYVLPEEYRCKYKYYQGYDGTH